MYFLCLPVHFGDNCYLHLKKSLFLGVQAILFTGMLESIPILRVYHPFKQKHVLSLHSSKQSSCTSGPRRAVMRWLKEENG